MTEDEQRGYELAVKRLAQLIKECPLIYAYEAMRILAYEESKTDES